MGLDFDVLEYCRKLRTSNKPPYTCPVVVCGKSYKSMCGLQYHLVNFDHDAPQPQPQTPQSQPQTPQPQLQTPQEPQDTTQTPAEEPMPAPVKETPITPLATTPAVTPHSNRTFKKR